MLILSINWANLDHIILILLDFIKNKVFIPTSRGQKQVITREANCHYTSSM